MTEDKRSNPWKIGFGILAAAVVLWVAYAIGVAWHFNDLDKQSKFGDMFGGIGALFSGLALAGVVVAIRMQKKELEPQRQELIATRTELAKTAAAQQEAAASAKYQASALLATAKLNAHASLLSHYHSALFDADHKRKVATVKKIQDLLDEIDQATE